MQHDKKMTEPCILVVDDLEHELHTLKRVAKSVAGKCNFLEAKNANECQQLLEELPPLELAIVDLHLGKDHETDGLEIARLIKQGFGGFLSHTPVILITAYPSTKIDSNELENLADAFLSKLDDSSTQELEEKIKKLLRI